MNLLDKQAGWLLTICSMSPGFAYSCHKPQQLSAKVTSGIAP